MQNQGEWETNPVKLDTGACDWVFTPEVAKAFPLMETPNSSRGISYQGANGSEIINHGERMISDFTGGHVPMTVGSQIAEVHRDLASGFKIMAAGNCIILDDEGSSIQNKASERKISIVNHNGEFKFEIWVPKHKVAPKVKAEPRNPAASRAADTCASGDLGAKRQRVDEVEDDDESQLDIFFVGQV